MLRFAPSPTGDMHIATLRIAILNYLVSQQKSEQFLVRIADTDSKRNIEGKDTEIMMLLEKFALKHDSVFHQTEHLNLHQTLAIRLLQEGKAFVAKCANAQDKAYSEVCESLTKKEFESLKASGEKFVIRLKKPEKNIENHDLFKGKMSATPDEVEAFIILDEEGKPTANFATAADDMMSNIDLIIRDEKELKNTAKQIHIKSSLGYEEEAQYAHLSTVLNAAEASSVKWLFEQGFVPDAILNYLLLLGNPKAPKEVFTLPEAIAWFDFESLSKSAVNFDIEKLKFINREHLKMMEDRQLSTLFGFADADIGKLAKLYLEECSTSNELETKIRAIFSPKNFDGALGEEMQTLSDIIFQAPAFNNYNDFEQDLIQKSNFEPQAALRQLLTGTDTGPALSDIYPFIKSYILEVAS